MSERINDNQEKQSEYLDPNELAASDLLVILKEAQINNIRPIEEYDPTVSPHRDEVFVAEAAHNEEIYSGEINLFGKILRVVYKPDSGAGRGNSRDNVVSGEHENISPPGNKEVAAWLIAQKLNLDYLSVPVISRELDRGQGSIRPYIYGKTLASLSADEADSAYDLADNWEDLAIYDYLLGYFDRLNDENLIWTGDIDNKRCLKSIDHSLTFYDDKFTDSFPITGPRLMVGYDNKEDPPRNLNKPLPERLLKNLEAIIHQEKEIRDMLKDVLTSDEIEGVLARAHQAYEKKIFL